MTQRQFGISIMRWGKGHIEACERVATLTKGELEKAGITRDIALQWRNFYLHVAECNPRNPSAAGRAVLMQKATQLLT